MSLNESFDYAKNLLKDRVESFVYESVLKDLKIEKVIDHKIIITTPYEFNLEIVNNYVDLLTEFICDKENDTYEIEVMFEDEYNEKYNSIEEEEEEYSDNLDPELTFSSFVIGNSNRFAQNASLAVAMKPGASYSPLFIYSNSGLGKTHLLNAIGNYIKEQNPSKHIIYASTERFVNEYISSLQNGTINKFSEKYRNIDVLLVDDIQFMASKESSSEIFFNIFNALQKNNKQIVITSDKPPKELKGIENRLVSRFTNGLTVSIDTPEFETSKAIIKKKIEVNNISYPINEDVLDFIASKFNRDVRELEGSINRLLFHKAIEGGKEAISLEFALEVFADSYTDESIQSSDLTVDGIKKIVANYYNLTVSQINSKSRTSNIIVARHIAMYLVRKNIPDISFIQIGKEFGGRDHSTVMKACDKVEKNLTKDANYKKAVNEIMNKLS